MCNVTLLWNLHLAKIKDRDISVHISPRGSYVHQKHNSCQLLFLVQKMDQKGNHDSVFNFEFLTPVTPVLECSVW